MLAEACLECYQTSKMELFVKIISNFQSLNILAYILDVSQDSK